MGNESVIREEFCLSWSGEGERLFSKNYSNPEKAKKELAEMQEFGSKYPIFVSVTQTRIIDILKIAPGDKTDYSTIFDRPLDN